MDIACITGLGHVWAQLRIGGITKYMGKEMTQKKLRKMRARKSLARLTRKIRDEAEFIERIKQYLSEMEYRDQHGPIPVTKQDHSMIRAARRRGVIA